jgi:hypothetical protein
LLAIYSASTILGYTTLVLPDSLAAIETRHLDPDYRCMRRLAAALDLTSTALLQRVEELDAQDTA